MLGCIDHSACLNCTGVYVTTIQEVKFCGSKILINFVISDMFLPEGEAN